ncbi:MAG: glycoside hydrolase family 36 protein [Kordiimonas sp.]
MHNFKFAALSWRMLVILGMSLIGFGGVQASNIQFNLGGHNVAVEGDLKGFELTVDSKAVEDGLDVAVLTLTSKVAAEPPKLMVKWSIPSSDISGRWTPEVNGRHQLPADWSGVQLESILTRNAPVLALFGHGDVNRHTVAVSDAVNLVNIAAKIREEDGRIYNSIELLSEKHKKTRQYQVALRLDQRAVPTYTSLDGVSSWWASMEAYKPAPVPELAKEPMYSTWYSYHQNVDHDTLIKEVELAADMGFKAIIVDDGWQTTDSNRGYAYTGDWKPERLPEMKRFVDEVHERGMKALLWYSLPFVGENSEAVKTFEGKFLKHFESLGAYVLDPRYPEVREFLIGHYIHAVKEWGWDGLKLDFIDQFRSDENTVLEATDGRDYASVYEAVDRLMTDIIVQLREINPDVMIEFRQRYIGPAMRKYGNMFRATDIPNGAVVNRERIVDLRLLSGDTAVHSDMIMWHPDESVEIAALQFVNILFSVPQVSVKLGAVPEDHFKMIQYYTKYWAENRDVLLDGDFSTYGIWEKYPLVSAIKNSKRIVALYNDQVIRIGDTDLKELDLINGKKSQKIVADVVRDLGGYDLVVKDCFGQEVSRRSVQLNSGLHSFDVPVSGIVQLVRH